MSDTDGLLERLDDCPAGAPGWSAFENLCIDILSFLFEPAIKIQSRQPRTYSGVNRMDAIYSNRNLTASPDVSTRNWHHLFVELHARMILFEFKNYDLTEITHEEVNQTRNYLSDPMGKLAIMVCNKKPGDQAFRQRNTIYSREHKVILFLTKSELREMIEMKGRGEEPSDLIVDLVEEFYVQHE